MADAKRLRVVATNETSKPRRRSLTVSAAASSGDRLKLLLAMRTRVAKAVENPETPARDLAALTRRLLEIAKEIELLQAAEERDGDASAGTTGDDTFDASAI